MSHHGPVYGYAGDRPRNCGFFGVDDGGSFDRLGSTVSSRDYTYDDPDYAPGHGEGYTITVSRVSGDHVVKQYDGLQGPELPPDFERNQKQRIDLAQRAQELAWLRDLLASL